MISGFLRPVGSRIYGFAYTKLFYESKDIQDFLVKYHSPKNEIWQFESFEIGKGRVSKKPDGRCSRNWKGRSIKTKNMLVGPEQLSLTIVLEKTETT